MLLCKIYWENIIGIYQNISEDLDVNFTPYYVGADNRFHVIEQTQELMRSADRPDYLLVILHSAVGESILNLAAEHKVKVILQSELSVKDYEMMGSLPRMKYSSWWAHVVSADFDKGYLLGKSLLEAAKKREFFAKNGKIHVVGITGGSAWASSSLREAAY
ncbi:MAG: hypothetical protein ACOH5I_06530 [Oligoflexus sp.]